MRVTASEGDLGNHGVEREGFEEPRFLDFDIIVVRISGSSDLTYCTDKSVVVRKGPSVFAILCFEEPLNLCAIDSRQ